MFLYPPVRLSPYSAGSTYSASSLGLHSKYSVPISLSPSLLSVFLNGASPFGLNLVTVFITVFACAVPSVLKLAILFMIPTGPVFPFPSRYPFTRPSCIASARIAVKYLSTNGSARSRIAFGITRYTVSFFTSRSRVSKLAFSSPLMASVKSPHTAVPECSPTSHFFTFAGANFTRLRILLAFFTSSSVLSMISSGIMSICFAVIACFTSFSPS